MTWKGMLCFMNSPENLIRFLSLGWLSGYGSELLIGKWGVKISGQRASLGP